MDEGRIVKVVNAGGRDGHGGHFGECFPFAFSLALGEVCGVVCWGGGCMARTPQSMGARSPHLMCVL